MSVYTDRARELRNRTDIRVNCAQAMLATFAPEAGLTEEQALALGAHFGGGMKMGSVCGTITGALMVLGLCGVQETADAQTLTSALRESREGRMDCRELLQENARRGGVKKPFCDGLVYQSVALVDQMLRERGKI